MIKYSTTETIEACINDMYAADNVANGIVDHTA